MPTFLLATCWPRALPKRKKILGYSLFDCKFFALQVWTSPPPCCRTPFPPETPPTLPFPSSSSRSAMFFHTFVFSIKRQLHSSFFQPKSTFTSRDSPATLRCRVAHALEVAFDCDGERMKLEKETEGVDKKTGSKFLEASVRIKKGQVLDQIVHHFCP